EAQGPFVTTTEAQGPLTTTESSAIYFQKRVSAFQSEITTYEKVFANEVLSKEQISELIKRLETLKDKEMKNVETQLGQTIEQNAGNTLLLEELKMFSQAIKTLLQRTVDLLRKFNCRLKDMLSDDFESWLKSIDDRVQELKSGECNGEIFNKKCITNLQNYIPQLAEIQVRSDQPLYILNKYDCGLTPEEKKDFENRLLGLKQQAGALIKVIQDCLKRFFDIKISKMNLIKDSLQKRIKTAGQLWIDTIFLENRYVGKEIEALAKLFGSYQSDLQELKDEMKIVKDCLRQAQNFLTSENYQQCTQTFDGLQKESDLLCKNIKLWLQFMEKSMVFFLKQEVEKMEKKFEDLRVENHHIFKVLGLNCNSVKYALIGLKVLKPKLETYKEELQLLYRYLDDIKDSPKEYQELKAKLDTLKGKVEGLCEKVTKYIPFLEFYASFSNCSFVTTTTDPSTLGTTTSGSITPTPPTSGPSTADPPFVTTTTDGSPFSR
uniref:Uncharacterized protein n=2 Tax=Clytia hemisphaerica TaxID=252671 RepID=A0A7M5WUV6_9CNID